MTCTWELGSLVDKRVRVNYKVPGYGSRFPSMNFEENMHKLLNFQSLKNTFYFHYSWKKIRTSNLPCPKVHRIQIWAPKDWFQPEILGVQVSVEHTIVKLFTWILEIWSLLMYFIKLVWGSFLIKGIQDKNSVA